MSYKHLNIVEREMIAIYRAKSWSLCQIAKLLGRNKSTISRELARNKGDYLTSKAQARYKRRRKKCRPHKLLENPELFALVKKWFLGCHWSPEQIASRLKLENYPIQISYKTIYRAIYASLFDTPEQRRSEGNRGKIPISNELSSRPIEANERSRRGDWEASTSRQRDGDLGRRVLLSAAASTVATRHQREYQRLASRIFSERLRLHAP